MAKFQASFESLYEAECPDWFRDSKFGIWSHWGPQSVPMCGDWYARNMYIQGSQQYNYHVRHYGHPSVFGYKDICKLWKAEKFDPEGLMGLYHKAGARYFVGQAMHHDHFFNFPSKYNRFNSMQTGPMKDICGLWKAAADKYNMPFGLTEHLGATFSWWRVNKYSDTYGPYAGVPYDGNDPEFRDFYLDNYEHERTPEDDTSPPARPWYTTNQKFREYWLDVIKEVIDLYTPDLLYTDGYLPFDDWFTDDVNPGDAVFEKGLEAVAYLYNASIKKYGRNNAVYTQKYNRKEIYRVGILDVEKSQLPGISEEPWQTDTCIGNWFYDAKQTFKRPSQIIEILVDIVSKNGTMLLNILQKPDGSLDDEAVYILEQIGKWFDVCGEGIYGTRPWRVYGEGDSRVVIDGFKEDSVTWNSSDFRFTQKGDNIYAFILKAPDNNVTVIKSFTEKEKIGSVTLLGHGNVQFSQNFGSLTVKLPENLPTENANCLKITLQNL